MAKPLGLASEAELSTSPCERHRNVNSGFSVQIALAHAKVFQKLVGRLVQRASRGDHDGHDGVVKGQLLVVSIGLVHRVLQHFGDGVPSTSQVLRMLVRLGGVEGQGVILMSMYGYVGSKALLLAMLIFKSARRCKLFC